MPRVASSHRDMTCADGANRAPQAGACQEPALWLEELRTTTATKNDVVVVANKRRHIDLIRIVTYIVELLSWGYLAVVAPKGYLGPQSERLPGCAACTCSHRS